MNGVLAQDGTLPPLPGWNLTHFKLVQYNSGLRILKYYDGATVHGTIATPDGYPLAMLMLRFLTNIEFRMEEQLLIRMENTVS